METAVYTGSFDPLTVGHLNVIQRASRLVNRLVVGIGINVDKQAMFSPQERKELIESCLTEIPNTEVLIFEGLAVDFVRKCGATAMIRGVRPLTDIAAEFTMTMANRQLDESLETVFLMSDPAYSHVSSSLIKQVAPLADDEQLARFVPRQIIGPVRQRLSERASS